MLKRIFDDIQSLIKMLRISFRAKEALATKELLVAEATMIKEAKNKAKAKSKALKISNSKPTTLSKKMKQSSRHQANLQEPQLQILVEPEAQRGLLRRPHGYRVPVLLL